MTSAPPLAPAPAPAPAPSAALSPWRTALSAATLFAVDPGGLGGVVLRAFPGPARDRWLAHLRALLPAGTKLRRVPAGVGDERLLGGLDLAATLAAGRPVARRGLLAEADGGVLVLAMAERLSAGAACRIAGALEAGEVAMQRDGFAELHPARFGVVALDEGLVDESVPDGLLERCAFRVDLGPVSLRDAEGMPPDGHTVLQARTRLGAVRVPEAMVVAVVSTALALGIGSLRAPLACLRAARVAAALAGREAVEDVDVALAAALVLAPRATMLPAADIEAEPEPGARPEAERDAGAQPGTAEPGDAGEERRDRPDEWQDIMLDAVTAALPEGVLAGLIEASRRGRAAAPAGRAGAVRRATAHGRPVGVRPGLPPRDGRLHVLETLRAAAPWQRLRRAEAAAPAGAGARVQVRRDDYRVVRTQQRAGTTTVFVVDASGSAALHRLAEAKGAVELMLADCYVRRDRVAVLAFRGRGAELLLPPTRALVRARRSLAGLPGGGGTPLAAGLQSALLVALAARRRGDSVGVVLLTDGKANVALDGAPGRARADTDARMVAATLRAAAIPCVVVDTSSRPGEAARQIAAAMGARYLGLPHADPHAVARAASRLAA